MLRLKKDRKGHAVIDVFHPDALATRRSGIFGSLALASFLFFMTPYAAQLTGIPLFASIYSHGEALLKVNACM
jgi:hypothetical protein